MRAVVVREHGGYDKLVVEDRPMPEPQAGEARVRVRAIALNHLDTWVRRGVPGHTFPLPLVTSSDAAGVIDAIAGDPAGFTVGAEVIVMPGTSCGVCVRCQSGQDQLCPEYRILGEARDGCCAEYVVVPLRNLAPKPATIGFDAAAAFGLTFQTAWSMLHKADLRPGQCVLVHGGGSGVGSAAIQIARLMGATVLATAGSDEKCRRALDLGAHEAIQYTDTDFVAEVRRLRGRRLVDVVFDHVGAATFEKSLKCLVNGGVYVTCGATTGGMVQLNLHALFFKNLRVLGSTMGSRGDFLKIVQLVGDGVLRPVIDRVLPMTDVRSAHELLESRQVFGKIVLTP